MKEQNMYCWRGGFGLHTYYTREVKMNNLVIIVPVYNVENYLDECIESILNQDYTDFNVILIDDGSTDLSSKKCDEWSSKDKRIKTFHKSNGGLMSAWKYGVVNSQSVYVGFVDSDDWIESDMFSTLLEIIERDKSDMVTCGLLKEFADSRKEAVYNSIPSGVYDRKRIQKEIFPILLRGNGYSRGILVNRVTKLFKREMLVDILDDLSDDISIGEDLLTTFRFLTTARSISVLQDYTPYHYRINNQSMIKRYSDVKYEKIELLRHKMLAFADVNYDLPTQVNTDFIRLILTQLDEEILFSGKSTKQLLKRMRDLSHSVAFSNAVANSEWRKLSIKYRLYIWLFKYDMYILALAMRKIKGGS